MIDFLFLILNISKKKQAGQIRRGLDRASKHLVLLVSSEELAVF